MNYDEILAELEKLDRAIIVREQDWRYYHEMRGDLIDYNRSRTYVLKFKQDLARKLAQ